MIKYKYKINEEMVRWVTEVYVRTNQQLGWWVLFANPTAGPWKTMVLPSEQGIVTEIYRFSREEERPDLILVNDEKEIILIVETKDKYKKLIIDTQMEKSVRVMRNMSQVLQNCVNENWNKRKGYRLIPSFSWFSQEKEAILAENNSVQECFRRHDLQDNGRDLLNIVVTKDPDDKLVNNFVFKGKISHDLNTLIN